MPVTFEVNHAKTYYHAKWQGRITDEDLVNDYEKFFSSQEWVTGYNSVVEQT